MLSFWKYFMFGKCFEIVFESVWCLFWKLGRMFDLNVSKQLRTIYLLKSLCSFLPFLWYCYLTIDLVRSLISICKGTGVGHRITMISNVVIYLSISLVGTKIVCKETFVASSRDYDLVFLFLFAKISYMRIMTIYFSRQQVGLP